MEGLEPPAEIGPVGPGDRIRVAFTQELRLVPGWYLLCFSLANVPDGPVRVLDHRYDMAVVEVTGESCAVGLAELGCRVECLRDG